MVVTEMYGAAHAHRVGRAAMDNCTSKFGQVDGSA